ncbi:MAG: MBL fold metallo-hydrolase [Christensenellales bacterium]|jgi:glyoxylase-like metal-dependent hydrolase (beta-lactamase superfamily II)
MQWFNVGKPLPGVYHIQDRLGVCVTLITGNDATLLMDTGHGIGNLKSLVASISSRPLTVINSHAHYDHMFGNYQFDHAFMPKEDLALLEAGGAFSGFSRQHREAVWNRAATFGTGLIDYPSHEDYLNAGMGKLLPLSASLFDLGGITAEVINLPGHTPGSVCLLVKPQGLLLTGDNWNPTTWLFLDSCLPLNQYVSNMNGLLDRGFTHVLAPHQPILFPRRRLEAFINGLNPETFANAKPKSVRPEMGVDSYVCYPEPGTEFIFDKNKM